MKLKKIKKIVAVFALAILPILAFAMTEDIECYEVGAWDGHGHPICGIACTDGTLYLMDCEADIFQQD